MAKRCTCVVIQICPLHAAAPELLEALEYWLGTNNTVASINAAVAKSHAAIAKARGQAVTNG